MNSAAVDDWIKEHGRYCPRLRLWARPETCAALRRRPSLKAVVDGGRDRLVWAEPRNVGLLATDPPCRPSVCEGCEGLL
jgi:hypothetical protein